MTTDRAAYQAAYQSARQRALNRLAKAHRGEYSALLAEERAKEGERLAPVRGRTRSVPLSLPVFLTFEARRPCHVCGYQLRHLLMDTFRINKRSLAKTGKGPSLGFSDRICPECRTAAGTDEPRREVYAATADSVAKIRAYRLRRWPELATEAEAS